MDNKFKLLVIGLGALAAISLLIAFQLNLTNNKIRVRNTAIEQELSKTTKENGELTKKLSSVLEKNRTLINSFSDLEVAAESLRQEISALQERLDLASNERDSLIDKVQSLISDKRKLNKELTQKKEKEESAEAEITQPVHSPTSAQQTYWAQVLRQKADAELGLENVRSELKDITYKANELFKERDALQMELKALTQVKEDLERRALYNEKLARALSEDLVREKDDKEAVLSQLDKVREDSRMLRSRVGSLENTKTTLYKKIDSLEQQRITLNRKLGETEKMLTERVDEVFKIKTDIEKSQRKIAAQSNSGSRTVELSPIIVHGEEDLTKRVLTGRVLSFNKQNEFVIIDLGETSGARIGNTFGVYRDSKFIATIEVIQLRKDISAADIKGTTPGKQIKKGDIVKLIH